MIILRDKEIGGRLNWAFALTALSRGDFTGEDSLGQPKLSVEGRGYDDGLVGRFTMTLPGAGPKRGHDAARFSQLGPVVASNLVGVTNGIRGLHCLDLRFTTPPPRGLGRVQYVSACIRCLTF